MDPVLIVKTTISVALCFLGGIAVADPKTVFLEDGSGARYPVANVEFADDGTYSITMDRSSFTEHFLSMRPFRCLEGLDKTWCHVPYPYENYRDISDDLTDLEYDLLFVWKGVNDYGVNMWNGVYYDLSEEDGQFTGILLEMDMGLLAVPPPAGELRPLRSSDLHQSDPASHWLPTLVIE